MVIKDGTMRLTFVPHQDGYIGNHLFIDSLLSKCVFSSSKILFTGTDKELG